MSLFWANKPSFDSKLYNERTFYQQFIKDLVRADHEVIIESPFITTSRMELLYPVFKRLLARYIMVKLITRDPVDHDNEFMRDQSTNEILQCKELGVNVSLSKGHHHRKLAIIDSNILWEGSLNILSFSNSREIMRRIESKKYVREMQNFLKL
jgi:phosphatidylserine/phosphatidylglycerophosphate/cardiolipin synthase-like enzyme